MLRTIFRKTPQFYVNYWKSQSEPARACQFAAALIDAGVPCEFHLFPTGPHGMALCEPASAAKAEDEDAYAAAWVPLALAWLRRDEPHRDQASL